MEARRALLVNHGAPMGKRRVRGGARHRFLTFLVAQKRRPDTQDVQVRQNAFHLRLLFDYGMVRMARPRPDVTRQRLFTPGARHPLFLSRRPRRKLPLHFPFALRFRDGLVPFHRGLVPPLLRGPALLGTSAALSFVGIPLKRFHFIALQDRGAQGLSREIVSRALSGDVRVFRDFAPRRRLPRGHRPSRGGGFGYGFVGPEGRNRIGMTPLAQARSLQEDRRQKRLGRARCGVCQGVLERGAVLRFWKREMAARNGRIVPVLPKLPHAGGRGVAHVLRPRFENVAIAGFGGQDLLGEVVEVRGIRAARI